jgi:mRNA-degrading endonuclease RelE of RelBE toxin-antitoxin system
VKIIQQMLGHKSATMTLGLEGWPSARRGDFRVVYRIDEAERRVEVVAIDHHADVYRRGGR